MTFNLKVHYEFLPDVMFHVNTKLPNNTLLSDSHHSINSAYKQNVVRSDCNRSIHKGILQKKVSDLD